MNAVATYPPPAPVLLPFMSVQVGPGMGSIQRMAYDSLARRGRGMAENQHPTVQDGLVHILSMGHRLQTLSFDKGVGTVRCRSHRMRHIHDRIAPPPLNLCSPSERGCLRDDA